MKRLLLITLTLSFLTTLVFSQKRRTIVGDAWTGVVESANETTREITIVNPDKKTETFTGVLQEGYQVKMKDGSSRELKLSDIKPGLRIRAFYKSKTLEIAGQKKKANLIHRLDFLGRDDYTRLREMLKVEPSIPVTVEQSSKLPTKDPLKLHLAVDQQNLTQGLVQWVVLWNRDHASKHGRVELVDEPTEADVSLVAFWGNDDPVILFAFPVEYRGVSLNLSPATVYLAGKDDKGLRVFWHNRTLLDVETPGLAAASLGKELEKRLKARSN